MSHITITTRDFDSASGQELNARKTVDLVRTEADFHQGIGRDETWPPCACPRHRDPETGAGTALNLSGLHLVRYPEA